MPGIPAFGKLRQEDCFQLEASTAADRKRKEEGRKEKAIEPFGGGVRRLTRVKHVLSAL